MRKGIQFAIYTLLLPILTAGSLAANSSADSLILSAMKDELDRNLKNLVDEDQERPFFIAYTIADAQILDISASLGALNYSTNRDYKDWHVRLMVGDYKINDENFNSSQPDDATYRQSIAMPVDNDYEGIRRSLWMTTNNLFHSAARTYKNKMSLIAEGQISESDLQIEDFSRETVVKEYIPDTNFAVDKEALENNIRNLSAIFNQYPEVFSSSVRLSVFHSMIYFINSEGSETQLPFNITVLSVQAQSMTDDSDPLNKKITYIVQEPSFLPEAEALQRDIRVMVENMLTLKSTPRFEDDYYGPVLVVGEVAAETLEKFLFAGSDALIARRETLQSGSQRSVYYNQNENSLQAKMGKPVLSSDLTISAEPQLTSYQGQKLIGSFSVDAEAVIPAEKEILVEKGALKSLLNGRTPTREVPHSNGHMRFVYSRQGLDRAVGPGVIRIQAENTLSMEELKKALTEEAKEMGLDYALLIKSLDIGGSDKPFNFYKINVQTGEEELTRAVRLRNLSLYSLRRSPLFSETELVHNTLLPVMQQDFNGEGGIPSSFILPQAVLLKEVEMESYRKPLTSLLPLIENPVGMSVKEGKTISSE